MTDTNETKACSNCREEIPADAARYVDRSGWLWCSECAHSAESPFTPCEACDALHLNGPCHAPNDMNSAYLCDACLPAAIDGWKCEHCDQEYDPRQGHDCEA